MSASADLAAEIRALSPKAREAILDLLVCVRQGFTGSVEVHLKDGTPQIVKTISTKRVGDRERRER